MKAGVGSGGGCCQRGFCVDVGGACIFLSPEEPTHLTFPLVMAVLPLPGATRDLAWGVGGKGVFCRSNHLPGASLQGAPSPGLLPPCPQSHQSPGKALGAPLPHSQGPQRDPREGPGRQTCQKA